MSALPCLECGIPDCTGGHRHDTVTDDWPPVESVALTCGHTVETPDTVSSAIWCHDHQRLVSVVLTP